jgi:hypothetical protein
MCIPPPTPKIIGISGHAGHGKDTFFSLLNSTQPNRYQRYAFADALKNDLDQLATKMFGKRASQLTGKEKEIFRPILIAYGCAWRAINIDHWVEEVDRRMSWDISVLDGANNSPVIPVLTDVRFFSEYEFFRKRYGAAFVLVEVIRTDAKTKPPEEELKNQPKLSAVADFKVEWPTLKTDADRMAYVTKFLEMSGLRLSAAQ